MKRIMLLGGNYFQTTAVRAARDMGYYVITVDYLPDNPGHRYAHEYHNISTLDRERVLDLARRLEIDGILSYASDVSAPTAAYVAGALGLPTNPPEAVEVLTDKGAFRRFLRANGFNAPRGDTFTRYEDALAFCRDAAWPVMVKPTDSAGSKGVHQVAGPEGMENAWRSAMSFSRNGRICVEEFIDKDGYEIDADSFLVDGRLAYFGVMDQHNDLACNPFVPVGLSAPSFLSPERRALARRELQRLLGLLGMEMGALNVEFVFDRAGRLYFLEVGPRSGGNLISDTILLGSGVDLASAAVRAAVGDPCGDLTERPFHICVSSYVIHARRDGVYRDLRIAEELQGDVLRLDLFVRPGDPVRYYDDASAAIGAAILRFPDQETMARRMDRMAELICPILA